MHSRQAPNTAVTRIVARLALLCLVTAIFSATAIGGPPAICHPIDIGNARSLPWGSDAFERNNSYDRNVLAKDAIELLNGSDSALVHMETLRRATLYLEEDPANAARLLSKLMARALDAEASRKPSPLAWFDAGYFAQSLHQMGMDRAKGSGIDVGVAEGVVGYGWVRKAIELDPGNAELQFGAAVVTVLKAPRLNEMHAQRAAELAKPDSLVVKNLKQHSDTAWEHARGREG